MIAETGVKFHILPRQLFCQCIRQHVIVRFDNYFGKPWTEMTCGRKCTPLYATPVYATDSL